jgi:pseudouridine-5'-phosphate glycosidase
MTPETIARFEVTRRALGGHGGMLIANPVPEDDEIPAQRDDHRHIETQPSPPRRQRESRARPSRRSCWAKCST